MGWRSVKSSLPNGRRLVLVIALVLIVLYATVYVRIQATGDLTREPDQALPQQLQDLPQNQDSVAQQVPAALQELAPVKSPPVLARKPNEDELRLSHEDARAFRGRLDKMPRGRRGGAFQGPLIMINAGNETIVQGKGINKQAIQGPKMAGGQARKMDNGGKLVSELLAPDASSKSIFDGESLHSTNVIIYSRYRTGSTFASDFFRLNDDTMYMFEPLKRGDNNYSPAKDTRLILSQMLACNLDTIYKYTGAIQLWLKQAVFCELPDNVISCIRKLPQVSEEMAINKCQEKPIRVIKTVRVQTLEELTEFLQAGVKVVQVVRDPRGTMASRRAIHYPLRTNSSALQEEAREVCQRGVQDISQLQRLYTENRELVKNYYLVRYEDMARNASHELHKLYAFLGHKPSDSLLEWAAKSDAMSKSEQVDTVKSFYTTTRSNPAFTSISWRGKLPYEEVALVEQVCGEYLEVFGYRKAPSAEALTDYSISLLTSLDQHAIATRT